VPVTKNRMAKDEPTNERSSGERLQKVLAAAGLGSRRDCEELIEQGRVEVDRRVIIELGTKVDPQSQEIRVDGEVLRQPKRLYFAVNKPLGVVTTNFDPAHRPRVIDLVPTEERVFAVGRLDRSSEGLILVTNDGEFANRVTHPRYGVEKTYLVRVAGAPDQRQLARLKKGVHLAEGYARAQSISVKKKHGQSTEMVIVLNEGRNREIRRILARVGHKVLTLKRIAVGPIKLSDLPSGGWRRLLPEEIESLLRAAKEKRKVAKGKKKDERVQGSAGRDQGAGFREQTGRSPTPIRSVSEGLATPTASGDEPYLQKQALFSQPLSLDDLLRDDLDEGPLTPGDEVAPTETTQGGVIDYEPGAQPKRQGPRGVPQRREKTKGLPQSRQERESSPREDRGRKRGEKRVFGSKHQGRSAAGETAGNFRFRPKKGKKKKAKSQARHNQRRGNQDRDKQGRDNQRRGERRGKRKGRR
jgi:23S rRNA pseudouridine2605 synthase